MIFTKLPYRPQTRELMDKFLGYDLRPDAPEGSFVEMRNCSSDLFPKLSPRKSRGVYRDQFGDITGQQLYTSAAGVIVELYLAGGASVQLQPGMTGVDAFMNHAFAAWLKQTGKTQEECDFYDPDNSCWFPPAN